MRRPRWQQEGNEPDYRFSLANERTYLAWIRTGLGLLAGGVALDQFAADPQARPLFAVVAVGLAVSAAILFGIAYLQWRAAERALRHGRPLPAKAAVPLLASSMCVVALVLAAAVAM